MSREKLFSLTKKDFDLQFFCAGGNGGQNMQKNATACRIVHKESGAEGISRDERSQLQNKKKAFQRLIESPKFKAWHKKKCSQILMGVDIDSWVEEQMQPENLIIEEIEVTR